MAETCAASSWSNFICFEEIDVSGINWSITDNVLTIKGDSVFSEFKCP